MKSSAFLEATDEPQTIADAAPEITEPLFKTFTPKQLETLRARAQQMLKQHQHLVANYLRADGREILVDGATVEHLVEAAHSPYMKIETASGEILKQIGEAPQPVKLEDVWELLTAEEKAELESILIKVL